MDDALVRAAELRRRRPASSAPASPWDLPVVGGLTDGLASFLRALLGDA